MWLSIHFDRSYGFNVSVIAIKDSPKTPCLRIDDQSTRVWFTRVSRTPSASRLPKGRRTKPWSWSSGGQGFLFWGTGTKMSVDT